MWLTDVALFRGTPPGYSWEPTGTGVKGFGTKKEVLTVIWHLSVSLVLRDLIIMLGDLFGQTGDALPYPPSVLGGKTQHKVELYLIPAAGKGLAGTVSGYPPRSVPY